MLNFAKYSMCEIFPNKTNLRGLPRNKKLCAVLKKKYKNAG